MLGKITQLKWSSSGGSSRDLAFVILFLVFGIILIAKLAPYYSNHEESVVYNKVQTTSSVPKSFLERIGIPLVDSRKTDSKSPTWAGTQPPKQTGPQRPSVLERPLFDGQSVVLRVRSLNAYSSNNATQPVEVQVIGAINQENDVDLSPSQGGKLVGTANANIQAKRLNIAFSELVSADGRSYAIQGQAMDSVNQGPGVKGDYSSGLLTRIAGIALDRTITAADQIGTAQLFSAIGPSGVGGQELRTAAMATNQEASQNISAEATKGLRETPAEIELPPGSVFLVRVRAAGQGVNP